MGATIGRLAGKAPSDRPALKPYWGKPAVRNFRGGDGNVGIIRSPVRAIALPDNRHEESLETSILGSAGRGGILRSCLRMKNLNPDLNDGNPWVYVQGFKNPGLKPFQLGTRLSE